MADLWTVLKTAFGLPGRGKTHIVSAIGHELVARGYQVLFVPTFKLVQRLLAAKRDLSLETELKKRDKFDVVILDDIGYIQQERDEMEVLFTLETKMAHSWHKQSSDYSFDFPCLQEYAP